MAAAAGMSRTAPNGPAIDSGALLNLMAECVHAGQGGLPLQDVLDLLARLALTCCSGRDVIAFSCQRDLGGRARIQALNTAAARRFDPVEMGIVLSAVGFAASASPFLGPRLDHQLTERLGALGWPDPNVGRLTGLRFGDGSSILGGAILSLPHGAVPRDLLAQLTEIAALGGTMLRACRAAHAAGQTETSGSALTARRAAALELTADAYWEADADFKIRRLVLLGSDTQCLAMRRLEGMDLSLHVDSTPTADGAHELHDRAFAGVRVRVPQPDGSPVTIALNGMRAREASGWFGTAHLMDAQTALRAEYGHARELVIRLEEARRSEAALRAEAEAVLDGLRILLRPEPSPKLFAALLERLAEPLELQDAVILERDWNGKARLCAATSDFLGAIDWNALDPSLFAREDLAGLLAPDEILHVQHEADQVIPPWASALAIRLSGGAKPALLLCLHRAPGFFTQRHLGLGARLALVANQALLAEEERQKVVQSAKLASIGELAAGIVHEVNQPLSAIKLAVQTLELRLEEEELPREQLHAKLKRVDGEVDRIANIVRTMRVLARKSDSDHAPFNIAEAAGEAIAILRHRLRTEAIALRTELPDDLTAYGSRLEFAQVVLNVVGNAIDAIRLRRPGTDEKTADQYVSVTVVANEQGTVEICVRDTGPGIPQEQIDKVLEPFFTTKPSGEGTGLGLSLCQRMMRSMNGEIRIGNWQGGAEVRLVLPNAPPIAAGAQTEGD